MKIDFPIDTKEIGELDRHLIADYLEILLLCGQHDEISRNDFDDILRDQGVYDKNSIVHLEWFRRDPRFDVSGDMNALYIDVIWECMIKRLTMLGAATPFVLEDKVLRLDRARIDACADYILLLLCSKLRMVERAKRTELASKFEDLCVQYMQKKLFPGAEIRRFSRGGGFSTQLREAVRELADWLREPVRESVVEQLSDQGDGGLDIVGKLQGDKYASGTVFLAAQCAAREHDWQKKKLEAQNILAVLDSFCAPILMLFIPHAYRSGDGNWITEIHARNVALFDRVRLLAD